MSIELRNAYQHHRTLHYTRRFYARPATASEAIRAAREDLKHGRKRYGAHNAGGAGGVFKVGRSSCRVVENYKLQGFRLAGYSDELAPRCVEHTGWYQRQDDFSATLRGAVFLLPHGRAFAGYIDSEQPENAIVSMDDRELIECGHDDPDYRDVAVWADDLARMSAEESRAYDAAWSAGQLYAQTIREIATLRRERDAIKAAGIAPQTLASIRAKLGKLKDRAGSLRAGEYYRDGMYCTFDTRDADMVSTFEDGKACA